MTNYIIDISRPLSAAIAVWPGDAPFQMTRLGNIADGSSVNVTRLNLSAHTGTHADAPLHFVENDQPLDQIDLTIYWGPAQVVTVDKTGPLLPEDLAGHAIGRAPRLLVHSVVSSLPDTQFAERYPHPSPELAAWLAERGVILYGSDSPSMDDVNSKTLPGHKALRAHGIAILEGLQLTGVADGIYELVALPLKIVGGDGSPIRAVLRPLG